MAEVAQKPPLTSVQIGQVRPILGEFWSNLPGVGPTLPIPVEHVSNFGHVGAKATKPDKIRPGFDQNKNRVDEIWAISAGVGPRWAKASKHSETAHGLGSGTLLDQRNVHTTCACSTARRTRRAPREVSRRRGGTRVVGGALGGAGDGARRSRRRSCNTKPLEALARFNCSKNGMSHSTPPSWGEPRAPKPKTRSAGRRSPAALVLCCVHALCHDERAWITPQANARAFARPCVADLPTPVTTITLLGCAPPLAVVMPCHATASPLPISIRWKSSGTAMTIEWQWHDKAMALGWQPNGNGSAML